MITQTPSHKALYAKLLIIALVVGVCMSFYPNSPVTQAQAQDQLWQVQAIDTMKVSRDRAREGSLKNEIPKIVELASALNPTHISVGTPYDEEFVPVLNLWSTEIHSSGRNVWFRGNFSGWEGWFEYEKLGSVEQHHQLTYDFIMAHKELFEDGDIFTPIPEPENGLIGDPRWNNAQEYLDFLVKSYDTCVNAFSKINVAVTCGYYGTNGDIAKEILTPEVIEKIGGVVVIDHYVKDPQTYVDDINFISEKLKASIVIGEFGAPIPDIHGKLTDEQQAIFLDSYLAVFHQLNHLVIGLNYWVLQEGSTALVEDNLDIKPAYWILEEYYSPLHFGGTISNTLDQPVTNATVEVSNLSDEVQVDQSGQFSFLYPKSQVGITISADGYDSVEIALEEAATNITLQKSNPSWWFQIREKFHRFIVNISA